ncbi:hypothetical protein BJ912DRAFT_646172 [Pholiota molesta]|nr:hypothetical protein BJ912DRAFT_646172 [Pholiota molesta]
MVMFFAWKCEGITQTWMLTLGLAWCRHPAKSPDSENSYCWVIATYPNLPCINQPLPPALRYLGCHQSRPRSCTYMGCTGSLHSYRLVKFRITLLTTDGFLTHYCMVGIHKHVHCSRESYCH